MPDDAGTVGVARRPALRPSAEELASCASSSSAPSGDGSASWSAGSTPPGSRREELAELLPEAIALRAGRDRQLARALAPTVESAIGESVRRNPREIATAIFPVLGPAIRKAIAETLAGLVASINSTHRAQPFAPRAPLAGGGLAHRGPLRADRPQARAGLPGRAGLPDPCGDGAASRPRLGAGPARQRRRPDLRHAHRDPRFRGRLLRAGAGGRRAPPVQRRRADGHRGAGAAGADRGRGPGTGSRHLLASCRTRSRRSISSSPARSPTSTATRRRSRRPGRCSRSVWRPWCPPAGERRPQARRPGFPGPLPRCSWRGARLAGPPVAAAVDPSGGPARVGAGNRAVPGGARRRPLELLRPPRPARRRPGGAARRAGVDTGRVEQRWEPYLSLRPELVLARARRPGRRRPRVTLVARGRYPPPPGLGAARAGSPRPPGARPAAGRGGARPERCHARDRRQRWPSSSARSSGSACCSASDRPRSTRPAGATVARVAASFGRLESGAAALGGARHDRAGRPDRPHRLRRDQPALSRDRAEAVLAALAARGIPPAPLG